jgi:hypothetical protein
MAIPTPGPRRPCFGGQRDAGRLPRPRFIGIVCRITIGSQVAPRGPCPKGNHIQVLKNANQMTPRINTARPVLISSSASTDGPDSAWRASLGVSMIIPFNRHDAVTQILGAKPARSKTGTFSTSSGAAPDGARVSNCAAVDAGTRQRVWRVLLVNILVIGGFNRQRADHSPEHLHHPLAGCFRFAATAYRAIGERARASRQRLAIHQFQGCRRWRADRLGWGVCLSYGRR